MTARDETASRVWARIPPPGEWVRFARCRGLEPAAADRIFFPSDTSKPTIDYVGVFCNPCPVRSECVAFARQHHPRGVWGGESENERRRRSEMAA